MFTVAVSRVCKSDSVALTVAETNRMNSAPK
jgi:hypothetical protein